jgi:hypothetical protein
MPQKPAAISLEEFANLHELTMELHQRYGGDWYARFARCEVVNGKLLSASSGDGATEDAAMENYAQIISGQVITTDGGITHIIVPELGGVRKPVIPPQ